MARKPNLIIFLPDQQRADTIGNPKVHASALGKLASESFVFERAYVTHPVCTPSRSSLMTGLWPHSTGCTRNSVPLPEKFRVLPELLGDSDYRTAYMGKWHLGAEGFPQRGFQEWISTEIVGPYTDFLISNAQRPDKKDAGSPSWLSADCRSTYRNRSFSRRTHARSSANIGPIRFCSWSRLSSRTPPTTDR